MVRLNVQDMIQDIGPFNFISGSLAQQLPGCDVIFILEQDFPQELICLFQPALLDEAGCLKNPLSA